MGSAWGLTEIIWVDLSFFIYRLQPRMIKSVPQHPIVNVSHKFSIFILLIIMTPIVEVFGLTPTA